MSDSECVFCKIVKGDLPCDKIYEDSKFLAFLDVNPANKGHTLVIPKEHFSTILDMNNKLLSEIMLLIKKLSGPVMKAVGAKGFNIFVNNFEAAGQIVPHVHFHIVPRFPADGHKAWTSKKLKKEEMQKIMEKIKNSL